MASRSLIRLASLLCAAAIACPGARAAAPRRAPTGQPVVVRVESDGFHWGDAAAGAAASLGTVLIVAGGALALRSPVSGESRRGGAHSNQIEEGGS